MSDGKKLITALLEAGSTETLRQAGDDLFEDDELEVFRFVKTHYRRYGELPTLRTVETETRQRLPQAPEALSYYLKRLHDRKLFVVLREEFGNLRDALQGFNVEQAREIVGRMNHGCRIATPDNDVRNFRDASQLVLATYENAHMNPGVSGIPTGWPGIDNATGGYQRGDLVAWVARMGIGKTYLLLKQALHAWRLGYSVLIVTMEMTIEQIARRAIAMEVGMNPDYLRKGTVDSFGMRRLNRYLETMLHADNLHIYAGSFSKKVSDVEILAQELSPDIIYIDGAYLLRPDSASRNASRLERVAEVYDGLKKLTITSDRPIVTTSQFSRQAGKRGKDGSLETISFSDAIAMNSSLVLGVKEGAPPNERSRREIEFLKGREGESGTYQTNYRFTPIDFGEVAPEQAQAEAVDIDWMA